MSFREHTRDARKLTDAQLVAELAALETKRTEFRDGLDEGMAGSPGEWMVERMGELETEQKRRPTHPDDGGDR